MHVLSHTDKTLWGKTIIMKGSSSSSSLFHLVSFHLFIATSFLKAFKSKSLFPFSSSTNGQSTLVPPSKLYCNFSKHWRKKISTLLKELAQKNLRNTISQKNTFSLRSGQFHESNVCKMQSCNQLVHSRKGGEKKKNTNFFNHFHGYNVSRL